ncbi:aspartate aminotransferase family protein [Pedosphaera parvula]|uniref:Acetylornithine and succinylornithine aminotransferase n=1 Tax=Pedosphaera parvula (strain Ellin514) TaxID=320771 RepID=B9XQ48_PEDPL|nr:aspartate aminotransferase family protein [Pedosphaera parvula]EEF58052.1 acetylornithine and succinylornithine aminotransferase [Pedosphaera parvula Ellin514]
MKEIVPQPPSIVHNEMAEIQSLFNKNVIPSYGRFDIVLSHGSGSQLWDVTGKRYLDLGGGIAVCSLGHAPSAITEALIEQSRKLVHVSNLYFHAPQGRLAQELVNLIGPGKCFFTNSGVEANEGLFKLARKFGHDEGRFEIITTYNSFHGRTLAGISATGQDKVKKGFEPMVPGFRHVPYNDLQAMRDAISPATVAILVEGIQGEGGVTPATPEYLLGLRQLCDEKKLLLMMDSVQCGHFRSGRFQSYQRILEGVPRGDKFMPDAISMAKSLGGGFPIGAFWVRQPYADLLSAGTHGTTYGGSPLACAVALKILEVIQKEKLADNAREVGAYFKGGLQALAQKYPSVIKTVRGLGLMVGMELAPSIPAFSGEGKTPAVRFTNLLHEAGLIAIPAGTHILRFLPALNLHKDEAAEGLKIIESVVAKLAS